MTLLILPGGAGKMKGIFEIRMDAFLNPSEKALRARVRECLGSPERVGRPGGAPLEETLGELLKGEDGPGLLNRVLVLEETSSYSPPLGRALIRRMALAPEGSLAGASIAAAESIGSAAFLLDACGRAAREEGMFASVLMEAGRVQQALADFTSGLEALRFETYRALLLVEKGERNRGEAELEQAAARAAALRDEILRLAEGWLGKPWLRDHLSSVPPEAGRAAGGSTETKERNEP